MTYSIDIEKAYLLAKELGLEIEFDSETPGVEEIETGEIHSFTEVFNSKFLDESYLYLKDEAHYKEETVGKVPSLDTSKKIKAREVSKKSFVIKGVSSNKSRQLRYA